MRGRPRDQESDNGMTACLLLEVQIIRKCPPLHDSPLFNLHTHGSGKPAITRIGDARTAILYAAEK